MTKKQVGRLGGLARKSLYGNFGTLQGRQKGGLHSLVTHRKRGTGFKMLKSIRRPRYSKDLAEFIGIMLGDGHVGVYQATVTTNVNTDLEHARYVVTLTEKLFGIQARISYRKDSRACVVVISSREVCDFLKKHGLPHGNKVRDGVRIPEWIVANKLYASRCIRGLFDTDGSVYMDRHFIKGKKYCNLGIAFVNRSAPILTFFKHTLQDMHYHPTQKTTFEVFLRRAAEIDDYFKKVGSSNPKHLARYRDFKKQRNGGVA